MRPLYFDHNATTPVAPRVLAAMRPYFEAHFGNPGSAHIWGLRAKKAVDEAREQTAALIKARPEEIVFTGCATESNNTVLFGHFPDRAGHLAVSAVEHPSVLAPARALAASGVEVSHIPVTPNGLVDPAEAARRILPQTRLVSVMLAQNETGVIQPVAEIAEMAHAVGAAMHVDASQAVGKIVVDVGGLGADFLTVAGHKLYAPKGVGALFVRRGMDLPPYLLGGGQEGGRRSGTENVALIVGLGEACAMAMEDVAVEEARQRKIGAAIEAGLSGLGLAMRIHGQGAPRLPNTLFVGFSGFRAADILSECVIEEIGCGAGAACHGADTTVSHVLTAMGVPREFAEGTIRLSWGRSTTLDDAAELVARLKNIMRRIGP
ncbi:cysteine desulfurase family protein [Desulfolutivibrio sulfoxidireducens]|uniref:cysteine desulfurase family protein n=1 Tax=Desulfolutivibrio sulfoxidireducens TaxID=2773299 RepID=UPI00159E774D|nr:cysteine desulfurase family protein [Desulfolutivibrio sulfoxidireducens]QLA19187.1 aminotransferase class V-fold PLP-dependent enzyme [Desulfolutivibrio sulfoxidireducens]